MKYSDFLSEAFGFFKQKKTSDPFSYEKKNLDNYEKIDSKWISIIKQQKHINCAKLGYSQALQDKMGNNLTCKGGNYVFTLFQLDGKLYARASYHFNDSLGRKKSAGGIETKYEIKTEKDLVDLLDKAKL